LKLKIILFIILTVLLAGTSLIAKSNYSHQNRKNGNVELMGGVYDSFLHIPLKAKVFLLDKDSTVLDTTTCVFRYKYSNYFFNIPKQQKQYIIKCVYDGYNDCFFNFYFKPKRSENNVFIANHEMKKKNNHIRTIDLNGIEVKGTRIQVVYHGDTIIYDASAFVLPDGSMLEGLIRQMPGAELKSNGDIFINGEKIDYLTLNGKDFFKGKNKIILENLPYFTVKDIKVYHKNKSESERLSPQGMRKDFVMDVNLKREYIHNTLANAEVGAGTKSRSLGRLFGLLMGDHTNIAIFGNANNINENRKPGQDGDWKPSSLHNGVESTKQVGLNLESESKNMMNNEELEALIEWSDDHVERRSYSETFSTDGNIIKNGIYSNKTKDFKFDFSNIYRHEGPLAIRNFFSLEYNNTRKFTSKLDSTFREHLINLSRNNSFRKVHDFKTDFDLDISQRLPWKDRLGLTFHGNYYSHKPSDFFSQNETQYTEGNNSDFRNYYIDQQQHGYDYETRLHYSFMLPKLWQISPSVGYEQNYQFKQNYDYRLDWLNDSTYNELGVLPSNDIAFKESFDTGNSFNYNDLSHTYIGELSLTRGAENEFISISFPVRLEKEHIHFIQSSLDTIAHRSNILFQPAFHYNRYGRDKRSFNYRMSMDKPDFAILMPFSDNTNPLSLRINNPNLKKRVQHSMDANATFHSDSTDLNYWIGFDANYVNNAWGTRTTYNTKTGAFSYMNDNVSEANLDAVLKAGFQRSLDKSHCLNIDVNGNIRYAHSVDFDIAYNAETTSLSRVNTIEAGLNAKLRYKLRAFTIGAIGKVSGRFSRGDGKKFQDINACNYQYGANLQYPFPIVKLTLATDINIYSRRGYNSSMMNTNNLVWNIQLTHAFTKERIVTKLQAFDILHQLSNKAYEINAQGRTETWYNSIPSYLMFSISYNLTKKNNKNKR
jgi:hypothetical protein